MDQRSIEAYDLPQRVASYDADMDLMHPNRSKIVQIALDILPFPRESSLSALDLGIGTGFFTERFLMHFPNSRVVAIDGAKAMVDLAKARLGPLSDRVDFRMGDFRNLKDFTGSGIFDVVYSSYALHHLNRREKLSVVTACVGILKPDGWFINADIHVAESPLIEKRVQELRVNGLVSRANGKDPRFIDRISTRCFLDDLEKRDADQPLRLAEDLQILRDAGLKNAAIFWMEYRDAVYGGHI
jgi:ubiquinone/menaquinone biosynthesis C-methylase UbiE